MGTFAEVILARQPQDLAGKTYVAIRKLDESAKFSSGLVVNDLNPEIVKSLGFEGDHGVLVVDVEIDSPADRAGIRPGDLITKVGTKEVSSVLEFMAFMDEFIETNRPVSIFVKNKGFVTLKRILKVYNSSLQTMIAIFVLFFTYMWIGNPSFKYLGEASFQQPFMLF